MEMLLRHISVPVKASYSHVALSCGLCVNTMKKWFVVDGFSLLTLLLYFCKLSQVASVTAALLLLDLSRDPRYSKGGGSSQLWRQCLVQKFVPWDTLGVAVLMLTMDRMKKWKSLELSKRIA